MTENSLPPTLEVVKTALRENIEKVISEVAASMVALGAKTEWSMDDNFTTTEGIAALASRCGLPGAGDQDDEDLKFWGTIAIELGYETDYEPPLYVATINVPGYLPMDDDPPTFDSTQEAWEYLAQERRHGEEFDPDDNVTEDMASETLNVLHNMAIESAGVGSVVGPTPGYTGDHDLGLVYSVSLVEED